MSTEALAERVKAHRNSILQTQLALDAGEKLERQEKARGLSDPGSPLRSLSSSSAQTSKRTSSGAVPISTLLKKFQRASIQEYSEGQGSEGEDSGSDRESEDEFLPASMAGKVPPPVANGGSVFQNTKRTSHSGRTVYSLSGGQKPAGSDSNSNSAPQIGGRELYRGSDSWRKFELLQGPEDTKEEGSSLQHRRSFNQGSETGSRKQDSQKAPTQKSVLSRLEHRFSGQDSLPRSGGSSLFGDSDSRSSVPALSDKGSFSGNVSLSGTGSGEKRGSGKHAGVAGAAKSGLSGRRTSYSGVASSSSLPQRTSTSSRPTGKGVASALSNVLLDS